MQTKSGEKEFLISYIVLLSFHPTSTVRLDLIVHVSKALKRTTLEFKKFYSPTFGYQSRPKNTFSRDLLCLYHFRA